MDHALFHGDIVESTRILYTPSDFAKLSLLYLQEIGELHARKSHSSSRSNLSSYLFLMVLKGSGTLEYENMHHELHAGDCAFIDCRKTYLHETTDDLWTLRWIHFSGANAAGIYAKYLERGGQYCFHPENLAVFNDIWQQTYDTAASNDYIRDMRINEHLTHLFTQLMAESWHPERSRSDSKKQNLQEVRAYLEKHYAEKITLDDLSEQFFINKFYLTRVFKEQFGVSVNTCLLQIRITHAKQLLRFTDSTLEEIGIKCGMGALYYFSRTFKRVEGCSPSEYRKRWQCL